ncbi:MAG TPA: 1,4-butanediol diacrylate esterase [Gordonia polyisoprenivorans]|uniref:serine hydrolase domain-containing protein n=1 Tax=Gordonia polyisoprenivorans TaxID=84595 RepID=UPI00035E67F4|nr:serine hydrolase domain-containing protein [Gordonia polyisoprenivorans]OZC31451.1 1,4-butanediol diacrylate esterase [Gordonia polyisoprenivorans]HCS57736.1 1,4-butanediol diacrylate esterase [Gordonia polyisoprenivorans]
MATPTPHSAPHAAPDAATDRIARAADDWLRSTDTSALPGVVTGVSTAEQTVHLGSVGPIATDSVLALYSVTKSLTATVALQLVDDGVLDLDAPAAEYEPRLAGLTVLDGFDDDGTPRLREPASIPTTRQLLTHTAGFAYAFFDADFTRVARVQDLPDVATGTVESLGTTLMFDPGTRWEYGTNLDWVGLVIEGITGDRLGDTMTQRLLTPLGMSDTAFARDGAALARAAVLHARLPDGSLKALRAPTAPDAPPVDMGGQGLYSTIPDVLRFLRLWLRGGRTEDGEQLLRPETVAAATADQLGDLQVTALPGVDPRRTRDAEFFPGIAKGWNLLAMTNETDAPTGRRGGSYGWAGLANVYFWVDPSSGIAGAWGTQLFPFADPTAMSAALDFEAAVYRALDD